MKLKGPLAKIFGFSDKDFSAGGSGEVSMPFQPDKKPSTPCYGRNVEFEQQTHVNLCGDACLNMVFSYKKKKQARIDLRRNPRGALSGITTDDVLARLAAAGLEGVSFKPDANKSKPFTALELAQYLYAYGPLICKGTTHFILLVAVNGNTLAFHDPWRGQYMPKTIDSFNRKFLDWSDRDRVIGAGPPRR